MNLITQEPAPSDSTRTIPLSRGLFAIVDAMDYEWLSQWKWYATTRPPGDNSSIYATRTKYIDRKKRHIFMHREILGLPVGNKGMIDHIDGNGLNNSRSNLRLATHSDNICNRGPQKNNTSGLKGVRMLVDKENRTKPWIARIRINGNLLHLGYFATKDEAYKAYCEVAQIVHGKFANIGQRQK